MTPELDGTDTARALEPVQTPADDAMFRGLKSLVKSAAYASECPVGAFLIDDAGAGGQRIVASSGCLASDFSQALSKIVEEALLKDSEQVSVINDLAVHPGLRGADAVLSGVPLRFLSSCRVFNTAGRMLGTLIVADVVPHAGLSAAQLYVFKTHAAQIAVVLELEGLRRAAAENPGQAGRWSSSDRLRLLESVVVNANDAVLITDAEPIDLPGPRIVYCNKAFEKTTGYREDEVLGKTPRILQSSDINRCALGRLKSALRAWRPVEVELLNQRKDGSKFWVELSIVPVANEKGWYTHWVSVQRDVTDRKRNEEAAVRARVAEAENLALENEIEERKRVEARLFYEAYHDDLTKLRNRAYFMDRLERALTQVADDPSSACTVLFLDLNRFKLINDSLGHRAGDLLLMETGRRLRTCVHPPNTLARIGGDEFSILIEGTTDMTAGISLAESILEVLRLPIRIGSQEVFSSASIGIAQSSASCRLPEDLLRNADIAMYEAKNSGTGGFAVFTGSMHESAVHALALQMDLRHAVERNEFYLDYQPIYDLFSMQVTGIEALVRWLHPVRGLVGPDIFIPLAEEIGLIGLIGFWVLREACAQMQHWTRAYPHLTLRISVNASGDELRNPDYMTKLQGILSSTNLHPNRLQIEVTESVFLSHSEVTSETLRSIRALGIRIALDDFGTGYSSLSYLDRYPIDTIKIDQSFIMKMATRRRTRAIVEAIIALGRALNVDIVAEGVEQEGQLAALMALKCSSVQGFLLGRPMPSSGIDDLLMHQQSDIARVPHPIVA